VLYKNEGRRLGGTSFKMLGGAYAVTQAARRLKQPVTYVAATGGNHGASVAWGARRVKADCVLYIAENVSPSREMSLERQGARVIRVTGGYDSAVAAASADAAKNGSMLVADTSSRSGDPVVIEVMAGYGVLARELVAQFSELEETATHVFVPCGVGGLAAAVVAYLRGVLAERSPRVITCEPLGAASVLASIRAGHLTTTPHIRSDFSCLACGTPSTPAWEILDRGLDAGAAIPDQEIWAAQRVLQAGFNIDAGESAGASLAALNSIAQDEKAKALLGIDAASAVVLLGTEGT
jgi:diaminopropionate ammonia-lyase